MHIYVYRHTHICHIFSIRSSVIGHSGCFHVLTIIIYSAAMNVVVHASFQISGFLFSGCMARNRFAGLYGNNYHLLSKALG